MDVRSTTALRVGISAVSLCEVKELRRGRSGRAAVGYWRVPTVRCGVRKGSRSTVCQFSTNAVYRNIRYVHIFRDTDA